MKSSPNPLLRYLTYLQFEPSTCSLNLKMDFFVEGVLLAGNDMV